MPLRPTAESDTTLPPAGFLAHRVTTYTLCDTPTSNHKVADRQTFDDIDTLSSLSINHHLSINFSFIHRIDLTPSRWADACLQPGSQS